MNKFSYLKAFCSPFNRPKLKWYFGPIAIGTPYFFPKKTVKDPDKPGYLKFVPKKIGFDFVSLGYKTKWSDTDYRFEWLPRLSFVFFKWQIALTIVPIESSHYWEAWLYYENNTTGTRQQRIDTCRTKFPMKWTRYSKDGDQLIDYYDLILKSKYK